MVSICEEVEHDEWLEIPQYGRQERDLKNKLKTSNH